MGILGRSEFRMITRSAGETLLVKALRVIVTRDGQHLELESDTLSKTRASKLRSLRLQEAG